MGKLDGKVALVTGAARGQGRSHAVRLASEGADIIALDICADIPSMDYPNATPDDLAETVRLVEAQDRRIVARQTDVRDPAATRRAVDAGVAELGRLDIVLANAGIIRFADTPDPADADQVWADVIGTNLTGYYSAVNPAIPHLVAGANGGAIVLTGSTAGVRQTPSLNAAALAYTAAKTAAVGLAKQWASALAPHSIRVNVVHPTGVVSGMTMNSAMEAMAAQAAAGGANTISAMQNAMPVDILQAEDISDAILFLVSDQAKWITGVSLPVDAGFSIR